ncbi:hypothetical protein MKX01_030617 [Papaver californicum]|nr:hypothetical protein MKX01_030617 [Papaver californicum]
MIRHCPCLFFRVFMDIYALPMIYVLGGWIYLSILYGLSSTHFDLHVTSSWLVPSELHCRCFCWLYNTNYHLPLDIAHTRLAADLGRNETRQFRGIVHFLSSIRKKDGIKGIYRGLPAYLHGLIVHRSLYFGGFDTVKGMMSEKSEPELQLWKCWVAAQAVTTWAGLLSYLLDTVRRRMMMQSGLEKLMYQSTIDCWQKIYRTEGVRSYYRGAVSNMFRSIGAAGILVLYDEVKKFMNWGGL